jgi:hypothetical protein
MTFAQPQGGISTSQTRAVLATATPVRRRRHGSAVSRAALLGMLGLLVGASPAAAIVITGGPSYSPGGGWSCTGAVPGNEKLAGGATWTCSGTAGAFSNLYIGINNATTLPFGEKMNVPPPYTAEPSGNEMFIWSADGATFIRYTGQTTINTYGTVDTRVTLTFSGAGSVVSDATTQALVGPNIRGSAGPNTPPGVHSLWRIAPTVNSMTVNILIEASDVGVGNWTPARTFFGTTTAHRRGTDADDIEKSHVDIAFYTSTCGDSTVDTNFGAEACDQGAGNGTPGSCCTSTCAIRAAGEQCRASAGICDLAEACDGVNPTCPADVFEPASTVCRASGGVCDVAENCTGSAAACPGDAKVLAGTTCRAAADVCDAAEACDGVNDACPADVFEPASTVCRASGGVCDVAENCTGSSPACPGDAKVASGTTCRASAGVCDVAEACDGVSDTCPADVFEPGTTQCRASAGECDPAESCTGAGPDCPADARDPAGTACSTDGNPCTLDQCNGTSPACQHPAGNAGTVCRTGSGDVCDPDEVCDGINTTCPADVILPPTFFCRPAVDECDEAEGCGMLPGQPCPPDQKKAAGSLCTSDGNVCTLDQCNGVSDACQHPAGNAGAVCRASAGVCDVDETCDGTSTACPADALEPATTVCRASAGECDVAESCTGSTADCPSDAKTPAGTACTDDGSVCSLDECDGTSDDCQHPAGNAGTECRAAAGVCDVAEACDGVSDACPPDGFEPATTECRPAAGVCDVAETCTGSSAACPANSVSGAFVVCRASGGECDPAENCDAGTVTCPADAKDPANTPCTSDGSVCTLDVCDGVGDLCTHPAGNAGTECRAAAGVCDIAESCDGSSTTCPADTRQPSGFTCRAAAGVCDVAESCDGSSATCPADALQPIGVVCRAAGGTCDVAEVCTGLLATCPPDVVAPDGTPCNDTDVCTAPDTCQSGECTGTPDPTLCTTTTTSSTTTTIAGPSTTTITSTTSSSTTSTTELNHFQCYEIRKARVTAGPVTVEDQFHSATGVMLSTPNRLCAPTNKMGEDPTAPTDPGHLKAWRDKHTTTKVVNQTIVNQFGTLQLDVSRADFLFVPTSKDLSAPPSPLAPPTPDHFQCYKVRKSRGAAKFVRINGVTGEDQFGPYSLDLLRPRYLCAPANKNNEDPTAPSHTGHLLCYKARNNSGPFLRRTVFTNDQFGPQNTELLRRVELCVPSLKNP